MLIRYEKTTEHDIVLVIDEVDKFLGKIDLFDLVDCIDREKEPLNEDEYLYWFVDKEKLNLFLI